MSHAQRHTFNLTVSVGDASATISGVTGRVASVIFQAVAPQNILDSAALTVSAVNAGSIVLDVVGTSAVVQPFSPRIASHSTAGVAATYNGTQARTRPIELSNERVQVDIVGALSDGTCKCFVLVA